MSTKRKDSKGRLLKTGEAQRPNGSYMFRYKDIGGKQRWCYAPTLEELRELETAIQKDILDGIDYTAGKVSVLTLVERYIAQRKGVRQNTIIGYRFVYNLLSKHSFSGRLIRDIRTSDAKLFYAMLHEEYGYSYSTLTQVKGVLHPAFEMAVCDDAIRHNPFGFQVKEVVANDTVHRVALTKEQVDTYMQYLREDLCRSKYINEVTILLQTGIRVSELYGLTRSDIDFENRRIHIDKQLLRDRKCNYYIERPKTEKGGRYIPMSNEAYRAFQNVIANRKSVTVETVVDGCGGFLFLDINGKPKVAMHLEHALKRILDNYNATHTEQLPSITPHTFRHTFITDMYNRGIDIKTLQALAGHNDVQTTLGIYTHTNYDRTEQEFLRVMAL